MFIECGHCRASGDAELPIYGPGFLACPQCGEIVTKIEVSPWRGWIGEQIAKRANLPTRKQDANRLDSEIARVGLAAELAAVLILCPSSLSAWLRETEIGGGNRGRDLPTALTGLEKPIEVKQTAYQTASKGFLLVRPPRWTPGPMRIEYLDDAYYVLLIGASETFRLAGWIDRDGLIRHGKLNPVPVGARQRQCWGIHWSQLRAIESLSFHLVATSK